jgi:hypothetical protein
LRSSINSELTSVMTVKLLFSGNIWHGVLEDMEFGVGGEHSFCILFDSASDLSLILGVYVVIQIDGQLYSNYGDCCLRCPSRTLLNLHIPTPQLVSDSLHEGPEALF